MTHNIPFYIDLPDPFCDGEWDVFQCDKVFGCYIASESLKSIFNEPSFKPVASNEWAEHDGAEYDLTDLRLNKKEITITFNIINVALFNEFLVALQSRSDEIEIEMLFPERIRSGGEYIEGTNNYCIYCYLSKNNLFKRVNQLGQFSLTFIVPNPENYGAGQRQRQRPSGSHFGLPKQGYSLDGIDLNDYNIAVLDGTEDNLMLMPRIREHLCVDWKLDQGYLYADGSTYNKPKEIALNLLMIGAQFTPWYNEQWLPFWGNLLADGEHLLKCGNGMELRVFYKSCNITKFHTRHDLTHWWIEFTLTLICIDYRPQYEWNVLLATEEDKFVKTEKKNKYINLDYD